MQPLQQQPQFPGWLGIARQLNGATIGGRNFHVDHLYARKLLQHAARCQSWCMRMQLLGQGDVQAVGQEGDEDMGFDSHFALIDF